MTNNLPGQFNAEDISPREILLSYDNVLYIQGVIDATYAIDGKNTNKTDELRAGCLMALITSSNLWVPCKRTTCAEVASGSGSAGAATFEVDDSRFFKVSDTIDVGTENTSLTITAIDYDNDLITVDSAVTNLADGDVVVASGDIAGAETCRAILNDFVDLQENRKGETTTKDKSTGKLLIQGLVDNDKILGDLTAVRADTSAQLDGILWGDEQGT